MPTVKRRKVDRSQKSPAPLILAFSLDEKTSREIESMSNALAANHPDIVVRRRFVPAYVGEFQGFSVSVLAGVVSTAIYGMAMRIWQRIRRRTKVQLWVSFQMADALARRDLITNVGMDAFERLQALNLESDRHPPSDITSQFHLPEKGYLFLYRDSNGRKHYYEVSTDGGIMSYKRYTRNQKSLLELAGGQGK
jgi:hypothetical protein